MKFIETKREELRRERIALNEQEWEELKAIFKSIGENTYTKSFGGEKVLYFDGNDWMKTYQNKPTITLAELKAKYFEPETREPKVGDWGYFWDNGDKGAFFSKFTGRTDYGHPCDILGTGWDNFSHTIPPHIQEAMKTPEYEVVYSFGPSEGQIVVEKEFEPGLYAGTRGGVNVVLKRITP